MLRKSRKRGISGKDKNGVYHVNSDHSNFKK